MKRYAITIVLAVAAVAVGRAQEGTGRESAVQIKDTEIYREGSVVTVSFEADFTEVSIGKNEQIIYRPVLRGKGSASKELGSIVLNGRNMALLEARSPKRRSVAGAAQSVRRINGTEQRVSYRTTVAYEEWMNGATLVLTEDQCGCGTVVGSPAEVVLSRLMPQFSPQSLAMFAEPQIEEPKVRHEKGSASVDFVVNELVIRPEYRNNREEINKIVSTIDVVKNDRNVEITDINIHGYASPEDTYVHNAYLAEHRTRAVMEYVKGLYDLPGERFTIGWTPEDWEGVRKYVEQSQLAHREELLEIIDSPKYDYDSKDWRMKIHYGEDYKELMEEAYPALRRSEYVISYVVRPFTAAEALEVMKVSPQQVSLYEMFWAAQSLGVNSEGYNEVIELAVKTYPEEPVANYNAAVAAVNRGELEQAERYLRKVPSTARKENLEGVIALCRGDYAGARRSFEAAASHGLPEASKHVELIDGLLQ